MVFVLMMRQLVPAVLQVSVSHELQVVDGEFSDMPSLEQTKQLAGAS